MGGGIIAAVSGDPNMGADKDRFAVTGARWSLPGAEAVLLLRVVITNGDFPAYWKFHLQQEHQRAHTSRYQHQYDLAV